ncbi:GPI-anchored cell wall beta-1,3-endoglucanase EglC [Phyllosticta capitalensis]|uniref:GPI-anchored cell wall beta-1,3-endoglucanase EglC n=1 Tax=Phyllosticta capitalensis TaxID=121624 RepID=A0ABR1Z007_9PEZI
MRSFNAILLACLAIRSNGQQMPSGILGFNSGATKDNSAAKAQSDFKREFTTAQNLRGSPGLFNSVRLYTMVQSGTDTDPISAFPAAIATNTSMLLGIWCSGVTSIDKELTAMRNAIEQYGQKFADLVVAISVGSEDLYRVSESGIEKNAGVGQDADTIVNFIRDVRKAIKGTILGNKPVGHVDSWSAIANKSNSAVIEEVDWIGTDVYSYYERDKGNDFSNSTNVFDYIYESARNASQGKPVWVTETGYPSSGPTFGQAVASVDNAGKYWQEIGCDKLFGRVNTWWYTLRDSNPANKEKFAITDNLKTTAKFNLTCAPGSGAPAAINQQSKAPSVYSSPLLCIASALVLSLWVIG